MSTIDKVGNALMTVSEFAAFVVGVVELWVENPDLALVAACFAFAVYMHVSRQSWETDR